MKFGRTEVLRGASRAKNRQESAGGVRFGLAPQKPDKNAQKRSKFRKQKIWHRKIKCWELSETRFLKVSRRSEVYSRGKQPCEILEKN